jgi:Tol biopolymer transport system component
VLYLAGKRDFLEEPLALARWNGHRIVRRVLTRHAVSPGAFSPDGKLIAVETHRASDGEYMLRLLSVLGHRAWTVSAGPQLIGWSFSPDSQRIVFVRDDEGRPNGVATDHEDSEGDLYVASVQGGPATAITHDSRARAPVWGPSGIAYGQPRERAAGDDRAALKLIQPDGTDRRVLAYDTPSASDADGLEPVAWSSDGARLLANRMGFDGADAWTIDVRSGRHRDLTGMSDRVAGLGLSHDGSTVLAYNHRAIVTIPFGGGRQTTLAKNAADATWAE